jgi:hypothetical protein
LLSILVALLVAAALLFRAGPGDGEGPGQFVRQLEQQIANRVSGLHLLPGSPKAQQALAIPPADPLAGRLPVLEDSPKARVA